MLFRLAVPLMLLAAPTAAGDGAPPEARSAIAALVAARYVGQHCPTYRLDEAALVGIVARAGLAPEDIAGRYRALMADIDARAQAHAGLSDAQFCDVLFRSYTDDGSHLVEKR